MKAAASLKAVMDNMASNIPLLIFANKQDDESAMTPLEVLAKLNVDPNYKPLLFIVNNDLFVNSKGTSVHKGNGLKKGLKWILELERKKNGEIL